MTDNSPNLLPNLKILRLIGEVDEFKGALHLLCHFSPERLATSRHVATGALARHGAGPSTWYTMTHLGLR